MGLNKTYEIRVKHKKTTSLTRVCVLSQEELQTEEINCKDVLKQMLSLFLGFVSALILLVVLETLVLFYSTEKKNM